MNINVSADWNFVDTNTKHVAGYKGHRIAIAGYTAVVEEIMPKHWTGDSIFEFTVLKDHTTIVVRGHRGTLGGAKNAAEMAIEADIKGI